MESIFFMLDECIEDLKSEKPGKINYVINRILKLRDSSLDKYKNAQDKKLGEHYLFLFLEYRRILYRLYENDFYNAIEMMREMQDEVSKEQVYVKKSTMKSAINRFIDWKFRTYST